MRANLTGNPILALFGPTTPALQAAILYRDRHVCDYCQGYATEVDHVVPRAQGGPTVAANLVAACGRCNREKGNQTPQQWEVEKRRRAAQMVTLRKRTATVRKRPLVKVRPIRSRPARPYLADLLRANKPH